MAEHTLGHAQESQRALDVLEKRYAAGFAIQIAQVYAWRGDRDLAFESLGVTCVDVSLCDSDFNDETSHSSSAICCQEASISASSFGNAARQMRANKRASMVSREVSTRARRLRT